MHKTKGNMSSQHRNELTGQKFTIYCEHGPEFKKLQKMKLKDMTDDQLKTWLKECKAEEEWCKPIRRHRRKCVEIRRKAEDVLMKREDRA